MTQRAVLFKAVDEEMRRFVEGKSELADGLQATLDACDPLTREIVLFRAFGGDYRAACMKLNISSSTYYQRLRDFRRSLIAVITSKKR